MMQCLEPLHGQDTQLRSPQEAGILHSLFGNNDAVIVMPTGLGKSDIFFAPFVHQDLKAIKISQW